LRDHRRELGQLPAVARGPRAAGRDPTPDSRHPPMIEVRDLSKWFRGPNGSPVVAVDAIRFTVRPGEVFGLLGPNGAGKTTTLRMLCTVLRPTGGTANVAGFDVVEQPSEVRRHVGFLSANTGVYDRMTAWEMVEYYGRLNLIPDEVLGPRMEEL